MRFIIEHHHHHHLENSERSALLETLRNMENRIMSEIDDLKGALEGTQTDLDVIKGYLVSQNEKLTNLTAQLTQLSQSVPPQVQGDVGALANMAQGIKDEADAIVASFTPASAADPASADQGGDTSGGADSQEDSSSGAPVDATNDPSQPEQTPTPATDGTADAQQDTSGSSDGAASGGSQATGEGEQQSI